MSSCNGHQRQRDKGFTLIELLVTVAIVGILASITLPLADMAVQRNKEQELRRALREIRLAIDAYKHAVEDGHIVKTQEQSGYPPTLGILVDGVDDAKSQEHRKIYFLRKLPRDPMAEDSQFEAEESWGKRSYESPPDSPKEGKDVFDVYSRSDKIGLNGIPYREW